MMLMVMNIVFYAILLCAALTVLAWCVSQWLNKWQAGVFVGVAAGLAVVALLVQMIAICVSGQVMAVEGILAISAFVFALSTCYMHFRLMGSGVAPIAAIIILLCEIGIRFSSSLAVALFMETQLDAPWIKQAFVLFAVGLGLALAYMLLGVITELRFRRMSETTSELEKYVTELMPKMVSHFGWWALFILSFALGAYLLWSQTLYGVYWIWQPIFVILVVVWLIVFIAKDVLEIR